MNKIIILKTNIDNKEKLQQIKRIFLKNSDIFDWSVDTEDIDKVLRIESSTNINEDYVCKLLETIGLEGSDLT